MATYLSDTLGFTHYSIQASRHEQQNNQLNSRRHWWGKDLTTKYSDDPVPDNALIYLGDVDYYINMPDHLSQIMRPTLIYTVTPSKAAAVTKEMTHTFNKKGELQMTIAGQAPYVHKLWNYNIDTFMTTTWTTKMDTLALLGGIALVITSNLLYPSWPLTLLMLVVGLSLIIRPVTTTWYVDTQPFDNTHSLILLTPMATATGLGAIFAARLESAQLRRLEPVVQGGEWIALLIKTSANWMVSIAKTGEFSSTEIPLEVYSQVCSEARLKEGTKIPITTWTIKRYYEDASVVVLAEFVRKTRGQHDLDSYSVCPLTRYQYFPKLYQEDAQPALYPFMAPLFPGAAAADRCFNNSLAALARRNMDVKPRHGVPPDQFKIYFKEFLNYLGPKHQAHPVEPEDVAEKQNKTKQLNLLLAGFSSAFDVVIRFISGFLKAEAYQELKDPRPISTVQADNKARYSTFAHAKSDILRKHEWYAFGKTPLDIALKVNQIANGSDNIDCGDHSRMDGHVGGILLDLEDQTNFHLFAPQYHAELTVLNEA